MKEASSDRKITLNVMKDLILEEKWQEVENIIMTEELPLNIVKGLWHYLPSCKLWDRAFEILYSNYPIIERFYYMNRTSKTGIWIGTKAIPITDRKVKRESI